MKKGEKDKKKKKNKGKINIHFVKIKMFDYKSSYFDFQITL